MKIFAENKSQTEGTKRVFRLVLEAENAADAAILFQKLGEWRATPPALSPWHTAVLELLQKYGESDATTLAHDLDIGVTTVNNRLATLFKMGLLERRAVIAPGGGRGYLYKLAEESK